MTKKLTRRGRHTILPIVGDTLVEVSLSTCRAPALVFGAADGSQSQLEFADRLILKCGRHEEVLEGSKPGVTFNPKELFPLLELLGCEVVDAVAEHDGHLWVEFTNNLVLGVTSTTGYEAWHFKYPRPGRPIAGDPRQGFSLHGGHGHLI